MAPEEKPLAFDQALEEIQKIVKKMESGNLSLEDSIEVFEKGMKLTEFCRKAIQDAEKKVEVLLNPASRLDEPPKTKPFKE